MKEVRYFLMWCVGFLSLLFTGCKKETIAGDGVVVSVRRDVKNFYNVHVYGKTVVNIKGGTSFGVEVSGYENILPYLETKVENGTLLIRFDDNVAVSNDNTEVSITMPSLVSLVSEGTGGINIDGPFVSMDILSIEKTGLGDIQVLNTTAKSFKLILNGNNHFSGFGLSCSSAIVNLNGNGSAELSVSGNLNATISGNGIIYYKGNPEVKSNITGNGQVIKK